MAFLSLFLLVEDDAPLGSSSGISERKRRFLLLLLRLAVVRSRRLFGLLRVNAVVAMDAMDAVALVLLRIRVWVLKASQVSRTDQPQQQQHSSSSTTATRACRRSHSLLVEELLCAQPAEEEYPTPTETEPAETLERLCRPPQRSTRQQPVILSCRSAVRRYSSATVVDHNQALLLVSCGVFCSPS